MIGFPKKQSSPRAVISPRSFTTRQKQVDRPLLFM